MLVPEKTSGPSCVTSRPSDSVRMIASLKSERLKPNEGSKPEFHLRWIRELVTRISSALDFLTTSRLIVTDRPDLDSFRFGDSGNNPDAHVQISTGKRLAGSEFRAWHRLWMRGLSLGRGPQALAIALFGTPTPRSRAAFEWHPHRKTAAPASS
jgi:hypothetical protein